jgi:ABC-type glutathione transport system ATPase component
MSGDSTPPVLRIEDLRVEVGEKQILRGVSLSVAAGEVVAVVGESGAGKSTLIAAILGLLPEGSRVRGAVELAGVDVLRATDGELAALRRSRVALVPQEPASAFHPMLRVGAQIAEPLHARGTPAPVIRRRLAELMARVGLPESDRVLDAYPHELSGGTLQRALVAGALATGAELLVADEPTASMDRMTEHAVLSAMMLERERRSLALLLVSHDLLRVASLATRTAVMWDGAIVEEGPSRRVLEDPQHPRARALMEGASA